MTHATALASQKLREQVSAYEGCKADIDCKGVLYTIYNANLDREAADLIEQQAQAIADLTRELDDARTAESGVEAQLRKAEELERRNAELTRERGEGMFKWQDIETAPRDGTKILAFCQPSHIETGKLMGFYYITCVWYRGEKFKDSFSQWRNTLNDSAAEPTHWLPLPSPPEHRARELLPPTQEGKE